jgi:prolyl oligopeptidase
MRAFPIVMFFLAALVSCSGGGSAVSSLSYPEAKKDAVADDFHGTMVADPYRWLEDSGSDDTKAWLAAQKQVEETYFGGVSGRDAIRARLEKLWDYPKYYVPIRSRGYYWFLYNDGLKNQPSLYRKRGIDTEDELLLDPADFDEEGQTGTSAITGFYPSEYSDYAAYSMSFSGSDWQEIYIMDTRRNEDLEEVLVGIKFTSVAWTGSGNGFYYCRYVMPEEGEELTASNKGQKIYYHKAGTDQSADTEVQIPGAKENWLYGLKTTADGRYLIIHIYEGTGNENRVYYRDIVQQSKVIQLLDKRDAMYEFVDSEGPVFYFRTNAGAPKGKLVAINIGDPRSTNTRDVIAETGDVLEDVVPSRGQYGVVWVAHYLAGGFSKLAAFDKNGENRTDIELPTKGSIGQMSGYRRESNAFFSFTSFAWPQSIMLFDAQTGKVHEYQKPKVSFEPNDFDVEQKWATSKDGAQVPMFLVSKKGAVKKGGSGKDKLLKRPSGSPVLMYGYGGFNVNLLPSFSPATLAWLEMGGMYVQVNLRGGNEFGEEWHKAGMLKNKQNVFNDFIAAGEWLIDNGYTSSKRLAIQGGSNGGLLVGAAMTQRPELFAAAVPQVGVLDMLRYHQFTIGWAWASEYGRSDDEEMFPTLYAYSPLHNVKDGTKYPATLIMTSDHDDRVVPAHSYKFAARLQAAQSGGAPVVLRVESQAGHGAGKPVSKQIDEHADRLGFLAKELGMTVGF